MSTEALIQLEEKIQNAIETISIYHMENEELREKQNQSEQEITQLRNLFNKLEDEKKTLQQEVASLEEIKHHSEHEVNELRNINAQLEKEQTTLKQEYQSWNDRVNQLLDKLNTATEETV
ncbi:MAG: cell division protein ZapB [Endozoicomonadaceae bacterium]|nr:cell division protein ZapB [Endozoicomonadaceae bacterium]MCY4330533.1 cell division protein ZapB [Endozoicomonadaceae bacterium]